MTNQNKIIWLAPEFKHYQKNIAWYITLLAIAVLIIGFFVIQKDYFAAFSLSLITVAVILFSQKRPEVVEVEMDSKAIRFGNLIFPYQHLKHFWVVHNENHKTLNVETSTYINNLLIIELENQDPESIRNFLKQFLPEHPKAVRETFAQKLMHKLKF